MSVWKDWAKDVEQRQASQKRAALVRGAAWALAAIGAYCIVLYVAYQFYMSHTIL
jgi:hypothetical protein